MKSRHLILSVTLPALFAICWTAHAEPQPATEPKKIEEPSAAERAASVPRMEKEQVRIAQRLQMSAPMEIELVNGKDPILEAYEDGFIIEATLEQVEAALAAAATTPDPEDDLAAQELRHRGSYRFFSPDSVRSISENSVGE
jgi:hypothetical protein